eukprot:CAMPEP_0194478184 /NCGR_PEP_ID=MMETSP0253-20130528/1723_1 /TAXON_ID=2966 /ORGANISM="Noctiluca scintillans" /LENGTH=163 /DNA_ID=CAMNT_0039317249 /DNA_START=67 /DNA_END=555 /DNA_ORIENTATION=-
MLCALAALFLVVDAATKVTPLQKVSQMLYELQTKVSVDGEAEANAYREFACFCKHETSRLSTEISEGEELFAVNGASLGADDTHRGEVEEAILATEASIKQNALATKATKAQMQADLSEYERNTADMRAAVAALNGAIEELKSARPSDLLQLRSAGKVRMALS